MDRNTRLVLLLALAVHAITGVLGQAPFLKMENQCGALYDPQLFHVCSAGASLRSARATSHPDPFAAAVMGNAQSLLDKAAVLLGRVPGTPSVKSAQTPAKPSIKTSQASNALRDAAARPDLVNRLKHAKQTLAVSACILSNSAEVLNDAIRALEDHSAHLQQDSEPTEAPTTKAPVVIKPVAADPPTHGFRPPQGSIVPDISIDVSVNGKPVDVNPIIEVTQTSSSGAHASPPRIHLQEQEDQSSQETATTGVDKLSSLNGKVHMLSQEVSSLLQRLGMALTTPHRSQSFIKLARVPLEEIHSIQLVLAKSEGAEMDDEVEAEVVLRDLLSQKEALTKMLDEPETLMERLKQPKDKNETQALVTELRALKKTVTMVLPHPIEFY